MEPEDEDNQYKSFRYFDSHRFPVFSLLVGTCARRVGSALQIEMCCVPWRRRNRFGDGEENGRPRFHNGRRAGNKMPAYGKSLKAEDITGLVAYIRTLKK
jgi:hypothetical protein